MILQAICTELASKEEEEGGINELSEGISSFSRDFYQVKYFDGNNYILFFKISNSIQAFHY